MQVNAIPAGALAQGVSGASASSSFTGTSLAGTSSSGTTGSFGATLASSMNTSDAPRADSNFGSRSKQAAEQADAGTGSSSTFSSEGTMGATGSRTYWKGARDAIANSAAKVNSSDGNSKSTNSKAGGRAYGRPAGTALDAGGTAQTLLPALSGGVESSLNLLMIVSANAPVPVLKVTESSADGSSRVQPVATPATASTTTAATSAPLLALQTTAQSMIVPRLDVSTAAQNAEASASSSSATGDDLSGLAAPAANISDIQAASATSPEAEAEARAITAAAYANSFGQPGGTHVEAGSGSSTSESQQQSLPAICSDLSANNLSADIVPPTIKLSVAEMRAPQAAAFAVSGTTTGISSFGPSRNPSANQETANVNQAVLNRTVEENQISQMSRAPLFFTDGIQSNDSSAIVSTADSHLQLAVFAAAASASVSNTGKQESQQGPISAEPATLSTSVAELMPSVEVEALTTGASVAISATQFSSEPVIRSAATGPLAAGDVADPAGEYLRASAAQAPTASTIETPASFFGRAMFRNTFDRGTPELATPVRALSATPMTVGGTALPEEANSGPVNSGTNDSGMPGFGKPDSTVPASIGDPISTVSTKAADDVPLSTPARPGLSSVSTGSACLASGGDDVAPLVVQDGAKQIAIFEPAGPRAGDAAGAVAVAREGTATSSAPALTESSSILSAGVSADVEAEGAPQTDVAVPDPAAGNNANNLDGIPNGIPSRIPNNSANDNPPNSVATSTLASLMDGANSARGEALENGNRSRLSQPSAAQAPRTMSAAEPQVVGPVPTGFNERQVGKNGNEPASGSQVSNASATSDAAQFIAQAPKELSTNGVATNDPSANGLSNHEAAVADASADTAVPASMPAASQTAFPDKPMSQADKKLPGAAAPSAAAARDFAPTATAGMISTGTLPVSASTISTPPLQGPAAASESTSNVSTDLPQAHQMLDAAPAAPALPVASGAPTPAAEAQMNAQMHVGVRTDAFGAVEIHTVVQQSQVGLSVHSDRDIARWFNSEVPGLESGLSKSHLNLTAVDFDSGRSSVQTSTAFQQGQPQQNSYQSSGARSVALRTQDVARKSSTIDTLPSDVGFRPGITRVSIHA